MVVKRYISQIKTRRGLMALSALLIVVAAGAGAITMLSPTKLKPIAAITYSAPPEVKGISTNQPSKDTSQNSTTNTTTNTTPSTASSTNSKTTTSSSSTTPPAPKVSAPPPVTPTPPPAPTPTITGLHLDQPYFDDTKAPIVTFTVPVTATGGGNVIISWVQDQTNAPICSITVTFASNESKTVDCTVKLPSPPQGVWVHATDTSGMIYGFYPTMVYIGGSSWE